MRELTKRYLSLKKLIEKHYPELIRSVTFIGGTELAPDKLRAHLKDNTFLDIWLSLDGDYSYHWEQRAKRGIIYRWDNAPDHSEIKSHPKHFHNKTDSEVKASYLPSQPEEAIKEIFDFIRKNLGDRQVSKGTKTF